MKHLTTSHPTAIKSPPRSRSAEHRDPDNEDISAALGSLSRVNMFNERHSTLGVSHPILDAINDLKSAAKDFILRNLREGAALGFNAEIISPSSMSTIRSLTLKSIDTLYAVTENLSECTPGNLNTKALASEGVFLLTSFLSHVLNERCGDSVDEGHRFDMVRLVAGLTRELNQLSIRTEAVAAGIPVQ